MHKPVRKLRADLCNRYAAQRVLGWVLDPNKQNWCKRNEQGIYQPYVFADDFRPMQDDGDAVMLIREVKSLSDAWYIQVEGQGDVFKCFAEEEGERNFGFYKDEQFCVAVTVALLMAAGVRVAQMEAAVKAGVTV